MVLGVEVGGCAYTETSITRRAVVATAHASRAWFVRHHRFHPTVWVLDGLASIGICYQFRLAIRMPGRTAVGVFGGGGWGASYRGRVGWHIPLGDTGGQLNIVIFSGIGVPLCYPASRKVRGRLCWPLASRRAGSGASHSGGSCCALVQRDKVSVEYVAEGIRQSFCGTADSGCRKTMEVPMSMLVRRSWDRKRAEW